MDPLLWLLLPVAALSGWLIARKEHRRDAPPQRQDLPHDYYRGLNYILNEQPDKAIELFIRLSERAPGIAEIHLTLGSLFRRRGDVNQAIRLHQELLNQESLSGEIYIQALQELALDYMSAGLLDRAEVLCLELLDVESRNIAALCLLQEIYEQEKEWFRAIEVARKIAAFTHRDQACVLAHYYCELANDARKKGDLAQSRRMIDKALQEDPGCGRALIILGRIEQGLGNYAAATAAYQRIGVVAPDYLSETLPALQRCYQQMGGATEFVSFLKGLLQHRHTIDLALAAAQAIKKSQGDAAALSFLVGEVAAAPSLRGVQSILDLDMRRQPRGDADSLRVVKESLDQLLKNKPVYRCISCGFTGMELHWCCPGCKRWSSIKPIQEFQWGASI